MTSPKKRDLTARRSALPPYSYDSDIKGAERHQRHRDDHRVYYFEHDGVGSSGALDAPPQVLAAPPHWQPRLLTGFRWRGRPHRLWLPRPTAAPGGSHLDTEVTGTHPVYYFDYYFAGAGLRDAGHATTPT